MVAEEDWCSNEKGQVPFSATRGHGAFPVGRLCPPAQGSRATLLSEHALPSAPRVTSEPNSFGLSRLSIPWKLHGPITDLARPSFLFRPSHRSSSPQLVAARVLAAGNVGSLLFERGSTGWDHRCAASSLGIYPSSPVLPEYLSGQVGTRSLTTLCSPYRSCVFRSHWRFELILVACFRGDTGCRAESRELVA